MPVDVLLAAERRSLTPAASAAVIINTAGPKLPERTLGWDLLLWAARYLRQPDGPDAGTPFIFTQEQVRFLLNWYAVDENGRWLFNSGVLRRMKGWGKDPIGAAMSLMELCAPTTFSHFHPISGRPVGKPHPAPWVQVAAVSREQTKNTFTLFPTMISSELKKDFGLDVHKEIIHKAGGGRIEAVTSSPNSLEGGRAHFVLMNETQFWMANNAGHDMAETIQGNSAKGRSDAPFRRLAICNAHRPGEDSVAEHDWDYYEELAAAGQENWGKFLYDAREAPADTDIQDEDSLRRGLIAARGDSIWLDVQRLIDEVDDKRTGASEARRKYLNQIIASEDAWITPQDWDLVQGKVRLLPGDAITLGFDGSKGDDHTALVACRISDAALFLLHVWNPKDQPDGKIPAAQVDAAVQSVFKRYRVLGFRADVREFESYIDKWTREHGSKLQIKADASHPIRYDMRSKSKKDFLFDCEAFSDAVLEGELVHDGNRLLRLHVGNARKRWGPNDIACGIGKETKNSSRKIDAAVCAVLAFASRQSLLNSGKMKGKGLTIL